MANTSVRRVIIDIRDADSARRSIRELNRLFKNMTDGTSSPTEYMLRRLSRKIEVFYIKPLIAELRTAPPKRTYPDDYPVVYKSTKQRKYVMWLLDGQPYERQNNIVNGWGYKIKISRGKVSIKIDNDVPEFKYVVGLIGTGTSQRSIKRYLEPMQPYHAITGWKPAHEPITRYIQDAKEDSIATIKKWLTESA